MKYDESHDFQVPYRQQPWVMAWWSSIYEESVQGHKKLWNEVILEFSLYTGGITFATLLPLYQSLDHSVQLLLAVSQSWPISVLVERDWILVVFKNILGSHESSTKVHSWATHTENPVHETTHNRLFVIWGGKCMKVHNYLLVCSTMWKRAYSWNAWLSYL